MALSPSFFLRLTQDHEKYNHRLWVKIEEWKENLEHKYKPGQNNRCRQLCRGYMVAPGSTKHGQGRMLRVYKSITARPKSSRFYEKMPERHVSCTFIKGHLSLLTACVNRDAELRKVRSGVWRDGAAATWRYKPAFKRLICISCRGLIW